MTKTKTTEEVPPTDLRNHDVGKPAVAVAAPPKRSKSKTKFEGKSLVPDLEKNRTAVSRLYWYWIGVTPNCPVDEVQIVGTGFPKVEEKVTQINGKTQRHPLIGKLVQLDEAAIRRLRERLPRTVIRFIDAKDQHEEPGTGMNLGDVYERKRRGHLITIPRESDVAEIEKQGRAVRRYVQDPRDQPAARYMFAQICDDQERGNRGAVYPETLETTGLEWPDEMKD